MNEVNPWAVAAALTAVIATLVTYVIKLKKQNGHQEDGQADIRDELELAEELGGIRATIEATKDRLNAGLEEIVRLRGHIVKARDDIRKALNDARRP